MPSPRTTDGVDVVFCDGTSGRYDLVIGADGVRSRVRDAGGHPAGDQADRYGHLAGVRPAAGQRHPHRPVLPRRLLHRRLLPHRRGHPLRVPGGERTGPFRPHGATAARGHAGAGVALPRAVGRHPRDDDRPRADQLHVVRDPPAGRAVEPRSGRADRRRRAHLPAHPRAGRRPGARGRRRPGRAAARRRPSRPAAVRRVHAAPLRAGQDRRRLVRPTRTVDARRRRRQRSRAHGPRLRPLSQPA